MHKLSDSNQQFCKVQNFDEKGNAFLGECDMTNNKFNGILWQLKEDSTYDKFKVTDALYQIASKSFGD